MRVAVAEDSGLIREGLVRLLEEAGVDVVAAVGDAEQLLAAVETHRPDAVVTDVRMPPSRTDEGLRAAAEIRGRYPGMAVLVLSQYVETVHTMTLLADNASGVGYLLKDRVADGDELVEALRRLTSGGSVVDPDVVARLLQRAQRDELLANLTERELDILALMAQGRSNTGIAERLHLSPKTVEGHIARLFLKLNLHQDIEDHRRVLAVVRYLKPEDGRPPWRASL